MSAAAGAHADGGARAGGAPAAPFGSHYESVFVGEIVGAFEAHGMGVAEATVQFVGSVHELDFVAGTVIVADSTGGVLVDASNADLAAACGHQPLVRVIGTVHPEVRARVAPRMHLRAKRS